MSVLIAPNCTMSIISTNIQIAADILNNEDVVAIPTETVYGLAGNIFSEKAIRRIFEVKQRPFYNPLIVHIHSIDQVEALTEGFNEKARKLAETFWPGPLTLVLKKKEVVPDLVTAGKPTVAIRMPNHPATLDLLSKLSFPLAAPSANPFNRISPTKALHVAKYFEDRIKMILDGGDCEKGIESTIVGFENGEAIVYRFGSIALEDLEFAIGKVKVKNKEGVEPNAPGMLPKHYAPRTESYLVENLEQFLLNHQGKKIGVLKFTGEVSELNIEQLEVLSLKGDLSEAASNLFQALHTLDQSNLDLIVAERFPDRGLGKTINDRLERATKEIHNSSI